MPRIIQAYFIQGKRMQPGLQVQSVPIDSITPYKNNSRTHGAEQIERIAASIRKYGFNQPIVVDENSIILVGHGRYEAAQLLGLEQVPVVVVLDLSDDDKTAYRILDNKLQQDSTWNFTALKTEFDLLKSGGYEFQSWGLDALYDFSRGFQPNLMPQVAPASPSEEDIAKKGQELQGQYEGQRPKIEVCCPECAATFLIDKQ